MELNEEWVRDAINGDRGALSYAFVWESTPQGHKHWEDQWCGRTPIDVDALKGILGEDDRLQVGNTYTTINGGKWECIFVRDALAWMTRNHSTAYVWDAETGESISLGGGDYNIAFPERRKGSVEYVYGKPDFDTWQED